MALGMRGDEIVACPIDRAIKEHAMPDARLLTLLQELHKIAGAES
jgi:hypothetical protein